MRNKIGTIDCIISESRDPSCPPADYINTSKGLFIDTCVHDIDMLRLILRDEFQTIYANGQKRHYSDEYNDIDTGTVSLTTFGGVQANIFIGRRHPQEAYM